MILDELLALPKSGVIILEKRNQVLVTYTTSMGSYLETLYNDFKGQAGIKITIRSAGADIETLKLHVEYYRDYYRKTDGYVLLLSHNRKTIEYKVRIVPTNDLKKVDVELVTARGDSKVVGRFKDIRAARDFVDNYYGSDNPYNLPVYAANSDTRNYLTTKDSYIELK